MRLILPETVYGTPKQRQSNDDIGMRLLAGFQPGAYPIQVFNCNREAILHIPNISTLQRDKSEGADFSHRELIRVIFSRIRCWNDVDGARTDANELDGFPANSPSNFCFQIILNQPIRNDFKPLISSASQTALKMTRQHHTHTHTQTIQRHRCVFTDGRVATLTEFITISFRLRRLRRWGGGEEG